LMELAKVAIIHTRGIHQIWLEAIEESRKLLRSLAICWNLLSKYGNFRNFFTQIWKVFSQKAFVWVNHTGLFFSTEVAKFWQRRKCCQSVVEKGRIDICNHPFLILWSVGIPHLNSTTLCTINVRNSMYFKWIIWSKIIEPYEHHQDTDWEYKMFVRKLWSRTTVWASPRYRLRIQNVCEKAMIQNSLRSSCCNIRQTPTHPPTY
jgi:hypothetical protein